VLPNDDLKVLTSAGLLLTFSGGHHVSLADLKTSQMVKKCVFWDSGLVFWDLNYNLVALENWTTEQCLAVNQGEGQLLRLPPVAGHGHEGTSLQRR
jgi:hypothetical protein